MNYTVKNASGGFLVVDDNGNHYGMFGSLSEAYGKIAELDRKPDPVIHQPATKRGRPKKIVKGKKEMSKSKGHFSSGHPRGPSKDFHNAGKDAHLDMMKSGGASKHQPDPVKHHSPANKEYPKGHGK